LGDWGSKRGEEERKEEKRRKKERVRLHGPSCTFVTSRTPPSTEDVCMGKPGTRKAQTSRSITSFMSTTALLYSTKKVT
jgi:hypothetical protein